MKFALAVAAALVLMPAAHVFAECTSEERANMVKRGLSVEQINESCNSPKTDIQADADAKAANEVADKQEKDTENDQPTTKVSTSSTRGTPDLTIDDFAAGSSLVELSLVSVVAKYKFSASDPVAFYDIETRDSRINLRYDYAATDELSLGITIPYQLSWISEAKGNLGNIPRELKSEEESGIDDISFAVAYRFLKSGSLRHAVGLTITWDNASDSAGSSEIKEDGIVVQQGEKFGPGAGYKVYSLAYHIGLANDSGWSVQVSPYYTQRDNSDGREPGNSSGVTLSGRYNIQDSLKLLFGAGYDIQSDSKFDTTEYPSYTTLTFGGGLGYSLDKHEIKAYYALGSSSDLEVKNRSGKLSERSVGALSVGWSTLF